MIAAEKYINDVSSALVSFLFMPGNVYNGIEGVQKLLIDIGYGLSFYPEKESRNVYGMLYGSIFIKPHLKGNIKLPDMDAKDVIGYVRKFENNFRQLRT